MKIIGTTNLNTEKDGYIYVIQRDYQKMIVQEGDEGDVEIDVSDIFSNAREWKWGIYNENYYSVILNAIAFKVPYIELNVPNVFLSIKKDGEFSSINALIFAKDKDLAFKLANQFRIKNRENIAFELSQKVEECKLPASSVEILSMLEGIEKKITDIKEKTEQISEKTGKVSSDVGELKELIIQLIEEFRDFKSKAVEGFQATHLNTQNKNQVVVHKTTPGVYQGGEKLYLKILGEVFDYMTINEAELINHFKVKIDKEAMEKITKLVKNKFFAGEKYITAEEFKKETGIKPKTDKEWQIVLKMKNTKIKGVVTLLEKTAKVPIKELDKAFKLELADAVKEKRDISIENIRNNLSDRYKTNFDEFLKRLRMAMSGGRTKELNGNVYVVDKELQDLLVYAIVLEAQKLGKTVEVR